jgi:hypothetical protein
LRKANQLLKKTLEEHNIKMGADGTTSIAWLAYTKVTSKTSMAAALSSDDSITFDVDTGAENQYILLFIMNIKVNQFQLRFITVHTVLLYVLFCLIYMYCTLYVLHILTLYTQYMFPVFLLPMLRYHLQHLFILLFKL